MNRLSTIFLGVLAFASLYVTAAQAVVLVRSPADLAKSPRVLELVQEYNANSSANVVYSQCITSYKLTPEMIDFQKELFIETAKKYIQAYHDAYVDIVGAEPEQQMVNEYAASIRDQQQVAVNQMSQWIQAKGCAGGKAYKIIQYVEKVRYQREVEKARDAEKKAKQQSVIPVSPMDSKRVVTQPIISTTPADSTTPTPGSN